MKDQENDGTRDKNNQDINFDYYLNYSGPDQVVTSFELGAILKQSGDQELHVYSKMPTLDKLLEGFESGELIAISGPKKSGKTLFAQSLTVNFLPTKSLWFSYELTLKQFLRAFPNLPLFISPLKLKAYSLPWVKERILEALVKHGIGIVFIDHLHFLFDLIRTRNVSLEIGQVIRFLKTIAIDYNLIIFILCHMRKITFDKEPDDSDVRDSSLISSESDSGIILWRLKNTENQAMVKIPYSRRTGVLDKTFRIIKIDGLLKEIDND